MCKFTTNVGLGPPLENVAGVFTDTGWYATSQFNVDVIFGHRMKQYECLTHDSYIAVAIFIPFYAGFAFILAVVFRMEQLDWSSSSSLAKSLGTVVSIDGAEKVLANTPKTYCFGARQGPTIASTLDKGQATKIQEQENLLRAAVNADDGLRLPGDQRQITPTLPMHLADAHIVNKGAQYFPDGSGIYMKNTPLSSNSMGGQNSLLQTSGSQLLGRSTASPSTATSTTSLDNTTSSPIPYANSPRSSTNVMNTTEDSSGFFVSLLFGLGPLLGGIILVAFALGLVPVVLLLAIGATDSWHGTLATAAIIGFMGPISAIGAVLAGIDYNGLDHVMVLACSVC